MENKVMIAGFGGQGVMLIGQLLGYTAKDADKNATFYPAYGPEQRGGTANCTVVISDGEIGSPIPSEIDVLVSMNQPALSKYIGKVKSGGTVIVNRNHVKEDVEREDVTVHYVHADTIAAELGFEKASNMVMLGAYLNVSDGITTEQVLGTMQIQLARKAAFFEINKAAISKGIEATNG